MTVPSASHQLAEAGSTTSASSAVRVRKMSWTTRWSSPSSRCSVCTASASDCAGFSPTTYSAFSSPRSIASNIWVRCQPYRGWMVTPQACSYLRARLVVALDVLEARQLVRDRAHVAAALHVVLAAQRVEARAVAADVAGQQRQVDQAEDVVDRVVVLGDAERPADHRAVGVRVGVRRLADQIGRHAGFALAPLERPRLDARRVLVEAGRRALDELAVVQPARG